MKLSENTKAYLVFIGYDESDFKQIEEAMNRSTFAIFLEGEGGSCKVITPNEAKELLGEEIFAGAVARSAFHFSASRVIPNTMGKYIISIDSGEMFGGKPSLLKKKDTLELNVKDLMAYQHFPHIYATNIQWDFNPEDLAQDIIEGGLVEKALGKSEGQIIAGAMQYDKGSSEDDIVYDHVLDAIHHNRISDEVSDMFSVLATKMEIPLNVWAELGSYDYDEAISDYISNESGYCHEGFAIECNMSIEDMDKRVEFLEEELEKEYKEHGKTDIAVVMEVEKKEIETAICLMEAERDRDTNEVPLEH